MPQPHFTADALLRALACGNTHCPCHRSVARGQGLTHCPAHDDTHPSLSVSERDGVALWNCKAGCDQRVTTGAIHQIFPLPERSAPDVRRTLTHGTEHATETVYDYGIARHIRLDFESGGKRMWWEPPGTRMADLPLWNGDLLSELRFRGETILLVEGEKDANRGVMFGFCAVSLPGGSSQRDFGRALDPLRGWDVCLIPDKDKVGFGLMMAVAPKLIEVGAKKVRLLTVPDPAHDLGDFLDTDAEADMRGGRALLKAMIAEAKVLFDG